MKKFLLVSAAALAVLVGAGWVILSRPGASDALGEWVARQAVAIAEAYIVPDVEFESFRYRSPGTLELSGLTLTAPDGTQVVRAGLARVILAETPALNQPITIETIELENATLRLLAAPGGGFKGLVPFVEGEAAADPEGVEENVRLSRVLRIQSLSLKNGSLEYDDGTGAPPMVLQGVSLQTGIGRGEAGDEWYPLDIESSAGDASLARLALKGALNVDTLVARLENLNLKMHLQESSYGVLPPSLQQTLREHDARGQLEISATGDLALQSIAASRLQSTMTLRDFNVASGEYRLPIDSAEFPMSISEGRLSMSTGTISTLGGAVRATNLTAELAQAGMPIRFDWQAENLDLQRMLRVATPSGEAPKLAGIVASSGQVRTALASPKEQLAGGGELTLREGRLTIIPVIQELAEAMNLFTDLVRSAGAGSTVDARFDLEPRGVALRELAVDTPVAAARGGGTIGFDGSLDLLVNGGPLEKTQGLFGKIGEAIGQVSDKLMKYHITGSVGDPEVRVRPLGL